MLKTREYSDFLQESNCARGDTPPWQYMHVAQGCLSFLTDKQTKRILLRRALRYGEGGAVVEGAVVEGDYPHSRGKTFVSDGEVKGAISILAGRMIALVRPSDMLDTLRGINKLLVSELLTALSR
ncbi:hypothetical protein UFOVP1299_9 [uncultured Caudovirales phage]|uniref:Uncharacterized protein n=1 Tax=uncultured Caudovirales phage TaxID=2100421 RepID=A0A6J5RD32_9CAUD|nr:hypothetical protein UFOVP1299_9 [uncultured Caudovirales phage]